MCKNFTNNFPKNIKHSLIKLWKNPFNKDNFNTFKTKRMKYKRFNQ